MSNNPDIKRVFLKAGLCFIFICLFIAFNAKAEEIVTESGSLKALSAPGNVTMDFKEADIRNVIKIISYKSGINIVTTPEVTGNVTIRLVDVPWEEALDTILKTYGFAYERAGNIITISSMGQIVSRKQQEAELIQIQPTVTKVFNLKYIDAQDAKKALEPQLSPRGKITVLETTGQAGWEFGSGKELNKRTRATEGRVSRSKTIIISDIPSILEKISEVLKNVDIEPKQIMIKARLVEVNHDKLKDIGVSWGTGVDGSTELTTKRDLASYYVTYTKTDGKIEQSEFKDIVGLQKLPLVSGGSKLLGMQSLPAIGLSELIFQKLSGPEFEMVVKLLEDKSIGNTLSAPHIRTLNNQEAAILIGNKYPLIKATVSTDTGTVIGQTLDRYQDIGIQLSVVPQISGTDQINLIIHPAVSNYVQTVKAVSAAGVTMAEYPIILVREAETQVLIKNKETIVIGGLIKDVKVDSRKGVPFLMDIPWLGPLFRKDYTTTTKVDLLIFITAYIIEDESLTQGEAVKIDRESGKESTSDLLDIYQESLQ